MLAGLPVSAPSTAELASLVRSAGADELAHRLELSPPAAESPAAGETPRAAATWPRPAVRTGLDRKRRGADDRCRW